MKRHNPRLTLRRSFVVVFCLALFVGSCGRATAPPPPGLDLEDLGLRVAEQHTLYEPTDPASALIRSLAFSSDGSALAVTRRDLTPSKGSWRDEKILETFSVGDFRPSLVASSHLPEAFRVFAASWDAATTTEETDPFILVRWLKPSPREIKIGGAASPDTTRSLAFTPKYEFSDRYIPNIAVAIAPDDSALAVVTGEDGADTPWQGELIVWDVATGKERLRVHSEKIGFYAVTFSPDGRHLVAGGGTALGYGGADAYRGELRCWELATDKLVFTTELDDLVRCVAFSPDGGAIATGGNSGTVRIHHATDGRQYKMHRFVPLDLGFITMVEDVAFSPDGQFLAAGVGGNNRGGSWGELRLLDLTSMKAATAGFHRHTKPVTQVAYSPDGQWLAAGTFDGFAKVFSIVPRDNIQVGDENGSDENGTGTIVEE